MELDTALHGVPVSHLIKVFSLISGFESQIPKSLYPACKGINERWVREAVYCQQIYILFLVEREWMHIILASGLGQVVPLLPPNSAFCLADCAQRSSVPNAHSGHRLRDIEFIFIGWVMNSFASSLSLYAKHVITFLCVITAMPLRVTYWQLSIIDRHIQLNCFIVLTTHPSLHAQLSCHPLMDDFCFILCI